MLPPLLSVVAICSYDVKRVCIYMRPRAPVLLCILYALSVFPDDALLPLVSIQRPAYQYT